jgi:hypothetical protein
LSNFAIRLRAYSADGTRGGVVRHSTLTLDQKLMDQSTVQLTVSDKVYTNLTFPLIGAIEWTNGTTWGEVSNGRFIFQEDDFDPTDPTGLHTLQGYQLIPWLMQRGLVQWSASAANGQRTWTSKNPGEILFDLFGEAQTRGWGPYISVGWSPTEDFDGEAWAATGLTQTYSLGTDYWSILTGFMQQGQCEYMTVGNVLRLFNPNRGHDWTTGDTIVTLRNNATQMPVQQSWVNIATRIDVQIEGNSTVTLMNPNAPTDLGELETWVQSGGVTDTASATALAQQTVTASTTPQRQVSVTVNAADAPYLPWDTYGLGDWTYYRAEAGWEKGRVIELVTAVDQNGVVTIQTVFGDQFLDTTSKIAQVVSGQTGGSTLGGNGKTVSTLDVRPPAAPQGFTAVASGYWDSLGNAKAQVVCTWDAVITATNTEPINVISYDLWMQDNNAVGVESQTETTVLGLTATITDLPCGGEYGFEVRGLSQASIYGEFATQINLTMPAPPETVPTPTAPVLSDNLGVLGVTWDGNLGSPSAAPPVYFSQVFASVATAEDGPFTMVGQPLNQAGIIVVPDLALGVEYWVTLTAVDTIGRQSTPTAATSITLAGVNLGDLDTDVTDAITAAQTTADGKNTVYYQSSAPTGGTYAVNDLWFDTSNGYLVNVWNGTEWVASALGTNAIAASAITAGKIAANSIAANMIQAGAVTTAALEAGAVTTNTIAAGAITANTIATGALDAFTITGAVIRTAASGARVQLDSTGLHGYNSAGTAVTSISTAGVLTATGATITGTLQTGTTGARAVMTGSSVSWYSANGSAGNIAATNDGSGTGSTLTISSSAATLVLGTVEMPAAGSALISSTQDTWFESLFVNNGIQVPTICMGSFTLSSAVGVDANVNETISFPASTFANPPLYVDCMPGNARFVPGVSSVTATGAVISLSNWSNAAGIPGTCQWIAIGF